MLGLPPGLDFQEVLADELALIVPRDYQLARQEEITLAEIARYPILVADRHSSTRQMTEEAFFQAGVEIQIGQRVVKELRHIVPLRPECCG